jgi:hypothetical protein
MNNNKHLYLLNNYDINYQGQFSNLTLSKEVTGNFGNRTKEFEFTITFRDNTGIPLSAGVQFDYVGDILPNLITIAPENGTLTLDNNGSAKMLLQHGQAIHIEHVPIGGSVQIAESEDDNYWTSFIDSVNTSSNENNYDTGIRFIGTDRTFSFLNARVQVPPTNVDLGSTSPLLLLFAIVSLSALGMFVLTRIYRPKVIN